MVAQTTLITAAVQAEVVPMARALALGLDIDFLPGALAYGDFSGSVHVLVTGVGKSRAESVIEPLLASGRCQRVVIAGFAGGTDPSLRVGDIVIPREIVDGMSGHRYTPSLPCEASGVLYTSAALVESPVAKRQIFERHNARAVDMESSVIAACCDKHKVPWACVRSISDSSENALPGFFLNLTGPDGRSNILEAIGHAILNPWDIPTMIRVGRDSQIAANSLAKAVMRIL